MTAHTCMAAPRIAENAVVRKSFSTASWGLPEQMAEEAIVRAASIEDKLRVRSTSYALRQIEPSSIIRRIPQTELDYLESSYGLAKSIR
jgi:hypothetical protein